MCENTNKEHICINDGDRKCVQYKIELESRNFKLEVIRTIFTTKMIWAIGVLILMAINLING